METITLSTKGQLVISTEAHLSPLPIFPRTTIADAAGLLRKRGRKRGRKVMSEAQICASISKTLKALDTATRT